MMMNASPRGQYQKLASCIDFPLSFLTWREAYGIDYLVSIGIPL